MDKEDMSKTCGFKYIDYWNKASNGEISQDEWHKWYNEHCEKCKFMCEICMHGEE